MYIAQNEISPNKLCRLIAQFKPNIVDRKNIFLSMISGCYAKEVICLPMIWWQHFEKIAARRKVQRFE